MRRLSYEDGQIFAFGPDLTPMASVEPGETVEVDCEDSCGGQIRTEADLLSKVDLDRVNGATGPIEVRRARPGDVLRVRIRRIQIGDEGYVGIEPTLGVLGDRIPAARTKILPIREGVARFSRSVGIPVRPHVGTIGVAADQTTQSTY